MSATHRCPMPGRLARNPLGRRLVARIVDTHRIVPHVAAPLDLVPCVVAARIAARPLPGLAVVAALAVAVLSPGAVAAPTAPTSKSTSRFVSGRPDETIREVLKSLEASALARVPLERYAAAGLMALAKAAPCLSWRIRQEPTGTVVDVACAERELQAPWPPATSDAAAVLLSDAARLAEPATAAAAASRSASASVAIDPARRVLVCRALAGAVDDPFTAYLPRQLVQASGASPRFDVWPRDPLRVREVERGSDAQRAGVRAGQRIVAVDGHDPNGASYTELLGLLHGAPGTTVRVRLDGPGGVRDVELTRSLPPAGGLVLGMLPGEALYVRIPTFEQGIAARLQARLRDAAPRAVILDVRHNRGGYVPEAIAVADLFLSAGPIGGVRSSPGRPTEDFVARADPGDNGAPLIVLVDGASASASELLTMALKERGRARVLGAATAGKGSVQRQIHLPDGGVLKVTAAIYTGPRGTPLGDRGVLPDRYLAPPSLATIFEGAPPASDPWVASALDTLRVEPKAHARRIGPSP